MFYVNQVEASVENGGQAAAVVESKEFDPLQQQHLQVASEKVMQPQQVTGVKLSDDQVSVSSSVSSRPEGHRQPPDVTAAAAAQGNCYSRLSPQSDFGQLYKVKCENMKNLDCPSFPMVC